MDILLLGRDGLSVLLVSIADFQAAAPKLALPYDMVDIATVDSAHTSIANSLIEGQFYYATTQTATDLLQNNQSQASLISKFLEIAGLLALLIGGIGIVNTMQVILSRRKTELAMLKTTGYRCRDLYLLFGVETGLLGFVGGARIWPRLVSQTWKVNIRIALRNLGRQRARTTTVMLALFVGVSTIGLILGLSDGLQSELSTAISSNVSFNVAVITTSNETHTLQTHLGTLPGLVASE